MTKQLNIVSFIAILLSLAVTSNAQNENWYLCKFMPWICPQTTASPTLSPSPTTTVGKVTESPTFLIEGTNAPTLPLSKVPSSPPSISDSASPSKSAVPSLEPTEEPTTSPSNQPSSHPTLEPTEIPSNEPSETPTFTRR